MPTMPIKGLLLIVCFLALPPLTAQAQELTSLTAPPSAADARARYLERWLAWMSRERHSARVSRGVWRLVAAGAFGTSAAAALILEERQRNPGGVVAVDDGPRMQGIALTTGITAALLADGVVALSSDSNEEERYQRWLALRRRDDATVAQFEGELAAGAAESRNAARWGGAIWIGVASTGASMLALTPLRGRNETASYAVGALLLGIGVWKAIASFTGETWREREHTGCTRSAAGRGPSRASASHHRSQPMAAGSHSAARSDASHHCSRAARGSASIRRMLYTLVSASCIACRDVLGLCSGVVVGTAAHEAQRVIRVQPVVPRACDECCTQLDLRRSSRERSRCRNSGSSRKGIKLRGRQRRSLPRIH